MNTYDWSDLYESWRITGHDNVLERRARLRAHAAVRDLQSIRNVIEDYNKLEIELGGLEDWRLELRQEAVEDYMCELDKINQLCLHSWIEDYTEDIDPVGRKQLVETRVYCSVCGLDYSWLTPPERPEFPTF